MSTTLSAKKATPTNKPSSNTIWLRLKDLSGISDSVWVSGFINGGASSLQLLQADGSFANPPAATIISVSANTSWQATGVTITNGATTTYTTTYSSGEWTADPNTNSGQLYNAGGCPNLLVPSDQTAYPMTGVNMGALLGKIGESGTPFFIGMGDWSSLATQESGELYLCINDDLTGAYGPGLNDNRGSVTVQISQGLPFYQLSSISKATLDTATNGSNRLIFVVSATQPVEMPISSYNPLGYTSYPYANPPGIAAPGPFDIFEFGMNAAADLSAVNGFGLNLSFTFDKEQYGVDTSFTRKQIHEAYTNFITNEGSHASPFRELLYKTSIGGTAPNPPTVLDNEFFAIADPNDMLQAKMIQGTTSSDPLTPYWDDTLKDFFKVGNYLSINLGGGNIYSGVCSLEGTTNTFTLSNTAGASFKFPQPPAGIDSSLYVFQQAFNQYTPNGSAGDAGLIQDSIWEALCRGVAPKGISTTTISAGESTAAWNKATDWYGAGSVCHYYAKFLHYSDIDGKDSRITKNAPIFYGNSVYGFSMDEDPIGPGFSGNVPSKTIGNVPGGSIMEITLGKWK